MNRGPLRMIMVMVAACGLALMTRSQQRPDPSKNFTSTDGAFQFSYPNDFQLCTAGNMQPCMRQAYIPPCEEDAIVCVVYPAKQFGDTNFGAAAFQVREIRTKQETMTPDVCVTPIPREAQETVSQWPDYLISAHHPTEFIGGVLFVHGVDSQGAMSHSSSQNLYRTFHRNKCYELSLSKSETNPAVFDPPAKTLTPTAEGNG